MEVIKMSDLEKIFFPFYEENLNTIRENSNIEFAYYSSLEVIHYILIDGVIWLRNASCMNDWKEIHRGKELFLKYFSIGRNKQKLVEILKKINETFPWEDNLYSLIQDFPAAMLYDAYIASLTEHEKDNDSSGKLSMWRGYGRGIGGAVILKKDEVLSRDISGVCLTKVAYFTYNEFAECFNLLIEQMAENLLFLKNIEPAVVWEYLQRAIVFAIISIKEPGFKEEREWRLVCFDSCLNKDGDILKPDKVVINGVPQKIYKLNIRKLLPTLLDHVIIGPTQYGIIAYTALKEDILELYRNQKYIPENLVREKLNYSTIPIRPDYL